VYGIDNAFVHPASVSMISLLHNAAKDRYYEITVLVPGDFSEDSKQRMLKVTRQFPNSMLRFVDMKLEFWNNIRQPGPKLSPTYYRLTLAALIPHEKSIYLDADTIVDGNICELFDLDLGSACIAGVKDAGFFKKNTAQLAQYLQIPDYDRYINAGILLMNLRKMRELDITSKLMTAAKKRYSFKDQDIINSVLYHHILTIPLCYNAMPLFMFHQDEKVRFFYQPEELHEAIERPIAIHFINIPKPWNCKPEKAVQKWLQYEIEKWHPYDEMIKRL
jgi:lipopolysaccharide biosynthesis glycosyltransferase